MNVSAPKRLLHTALTGAGVRLIDLPSRYGFHLLVAAELGALKAGQFYIVFSVMSALSGLGRLGIDRALTRQLAAERAVDRQGSLAPLVRRAYLLALLWSALVALALAAAAYPMARWVLHKPELATPLALGALSIIPQNLSIVAAGALAGLGRIGVSQMIYSWLMPALWCGVTLSIGTSVGGGIALIAGCFGVAAAIGSLLVWRVLSSQPRDSTVTPPSIVRLGLSLFTSELTQLLISAAPVLILGAVASDAVVGEFALAARIALIVNVLVSGVASMSAPKFAALFANGDLAGLALAAAEAVGLVLALSLVPIILMLAIPASLLHLFGPGFAAGAPMLRILAIGQLGAAAFCAMPELLGMTAHAAALRRLNFMTLAILIGGGGVLVPLLGGTGAALATALATLTNGASAAWAVRRHLGIVPLWALQRAATRQFRGVLHRQN